MATTDHVGHGLRNLKRRADSLDGDVVLSSTLGEGTTVTVERQEGATTEIRIALVDDHEIVRRGLRELLETHSDLTVTVEAGTFDEAVAGITKDLADVAVLDVRLGEFSGIDVCRTLRSRDEPIACLMLTSFADDDALDAAVLAGAQGYSPQGHPRQRPR
jgi:CheY-like chemotaxis protein